MTNGIISGGDCIPDQRWLEVFEVDAGERLGDVQFARLKLEIDALK